MAHRPPLLRDTFAAMNTISEYCIALDQGDSTRFASLFTPDGTLEVVKMSMVARGEKEIASLCDSLSATFKGSMHLEANPTLTSLTKDLCANESYWQAFSPEGELFSAGIHTDVLAKSSEDGHWRFKSRKIYHTWTKGGGREKEGGTWEGVAPQWTEK